MPNTTVQAAAGGMPRIAQPLAEIIMPMLLEVKNMVAAVGMAASGIDDFELSEPLRCVCDLAHDRILDVIEKCGDRIPG